MINQQKNVLHKDLLQKTKKDKLKSLISLAQIVRSKIEKLAAIQNNDLNLSGYCAISSYVLRDEAYKIELFPTLVVGRFGSEKHTTRCNHAWIEYYGKIIDITATQFNNLCKKDYNAVHVTTVCDNMYRPVFKNKGDVAKNLHNWYDEQNPLNPNSYIRGLTDPVVTLGSYVYAENS